MDAVLAIVCVFSGYMWLTGGAGLGNLFGSQAQSPQNTGANSLLGSGLAALENGLHNNPFGSSSNDSTSTSDSSGAGNSSSGGSSDTGSSSSGISDSGGGSSSSGDYGGELG